MNRKPFAVALLALCLAALAGVSLPASPGNQGDTSVAPSIATDFFAGLKWRQIGPNRGGRSIAVAGSDARPLEYFFGATGGGVWQTKDGGTTWRPVADDALRTSSVGAIAVAPSNPDIVYAGTGEVALRGNIIEGDGIYRSSDGGKTWKHAGLEDSRAIGRIRIDPSNPDIVYVAVLGHVFGPSVDRGVFRTRDGGTTWQTVLYRDERTGAVDLVIDPANPRVLYAALWEVFRTPHSLSSGGPGSGLFKSSDGGDTWTEITRRPGLPGGIVGKIGVSVSGADSARVYAIVEAADGGLFRSDDGGSNWTRVSDDRRFRQRAFYYTRIYADPRERDRVYVLNTGCYRSDDAGKSWKAIRVPHGDNHDLWIATNDPTRLANANDGGANVSVNGGQSWTSQRYPTAQLYHVVTTSHVPYHVCGAQQDNSTACMPVTGNGDEFYDVGGGESGYIAPDPRNPDVFYAGSYGGLLTRYDRRTGQVRQVNVWPENPMGHSAKDIRERFQWTFPIVFSVVEPGVLYVGSQHLWRSTTEGASWERISPDLTRADPATLGPSGGPITLDQTGVETYGTIFTVAPSRKEAGVIWVGSDDGLVHLTRNGGRDWEQVTPPDLPPFARISLIDASPHRPGSAYLAANRYQRDDLTPYFYRTDDYGKSWTRITNGIPSGHFGRAIREDALRPGLLYAGTERGIFVSFDNGGTWQSLRLNLPVTPVHDIVLAGNDVVIATHGRSAHVLDDVAVLRQVTADTVRASAHLFQPSSVQRSVNRGVSIDYWLREPATQVVIEILDAGGQVLRRFEASEADEKKKPGEGETAGDAEEGERGREPRPGRTRGMNRLTWDMREEGPKSFPKMILWAASARGPRALPGEYRVRLTVVTAGGPTNPVPQVQPFAIRKHPWLTSVSDADLQEQHRLAVAIRDAVSEANEAVTRIRALKDQVKDRAARVRKPKVSATASALLEKLTAIEGEIYQFRNQSSQDPLNFPIKLNNKLAALMETVDAGDGRPTAQSDAVFKELSARLDAALARLPIESDVAAFNRMLPKQVEPVRIE